MRYIIFSDIQGNDDLLSDFFRKTSRLKKDHYLCLGDIVGNKNPMKDNLCIQNVETMSSGSIKGNHDVKLLNDDNYLNKIFPNNKQYINNLNNCADYYGINMFHSSLKNPDKRLRTKEDYREELIYLRDQFPEQDIFMHGHSHQKAAFSYHKHNGEVEEHPTDVKIVLNEDNIYLFNPGGVGLIYGAENSFILYDDFKKTVQFYKIDELEDMNNRINLAVAFDERWMPNLDNDRIDWFLSYLEKDIEVVKDIYGESELLECLEEFDSDHVYKIGSKKKKKYVTDYSSRMATLIKSLTDEFSEDFNFPDPEQTRSFYLKND